MGGSAEFRAAHRDAGQNKPLYIDHPQFEGFEVRQTVRRGAAAVPDQRYAAALYRLLNSNGCLVALRFSWNEQRHHLEATEALADYLPDEHGLRLPLTVFVLDQDDKTHQKTFQSRLRSPRPARDGRLARRGRLDCPAVPVDGPVGDADRGRLGMGVFEIIEDER